MDSRAELLHKIQVCAFNLDDLTLFLNTHPDCQEAKNLFAKYSEMLRGLVDTFNKNYGLLSPNYYTGGKWNWIDGPWPWELTEVQ